MDNNIIEENQEISDENPYKQPEKNVWKELISQSRSRSNKFDNRTRLVFDALREKLKKT